MTYFTNWEEFLKAAEKLHTENPEKCRFVTKYNHADGKLEMKLTDDIECLQFITNQQQDLKRLDQLSRILLQSIVSQ